MLAIFFITDKQNGLLPAFADFKRTVMMTGRKIEANVLAQLYSNLFFWTVIESKVVIGLVEQPSLDGILQRSLVLRKKRIDLRVQHFFTQLVLCADF